MVKITVALIFAGLFLVSCMRDPPSPAGIIISGIMFIAVALSGKK